MIKTIKAKFIDGALVPLETLDLNEGDEVLVTLDLKAAVSFEELTERSRGPLGDGWVQPTLKS